MIVSFLNCRYGTKQIYLDSNFLGHSGIRGEDAIYAINVYKNNQIVNNYLFIYIIYCVFCINLYSYRVKR